MNDTSTTLFLFVAIAGIPFWVFIISKAGSLLVKASRKVKVWATPEQSSQTTFRKKARWLLWVDISFLLAGVVYCVYTFFSIPREGGLTVYWLLVYWQACFLIALIMPVVWLILLVIHLRKKFPSVVLWLAGLFMCGGSCVGFYGGGTTHYDSMLFHDKMYHLGGTSSFEFEYDYAVCECDPRGIFCDCRYFLWTKTQFLRPYFAIDSTANQLQVRINNEIIYAYDGETEHCYRSAYGYCSKGTELSQ